MTQQAPVAIDPVLRNQVLHKFLTFLYQDIRELRHDA